jgi:hypothetical protein
MPGRFLHRQTIDELRAGIGDAPPDCMWNPKAVEDRLIEALALIQRHGGRVGPRGYTPQWMHEVGADALEIGEQTAMLQAGELVDYQEALAKERNRYMLGASQHDMTLAQEASLWPMRYLADYGGPLRALQVFIRCRALRKRFGSECKRRGWARATAYRQRDRALSIIAMGLTRDRVPVSLASTEADDDHDEIE